jgi:hypothetical protein
MEGLARRRGLGTSENGAVAFTSRAARSVLPPDLAISTLKTLPLRIATMALLVPAVTGCVTTIRAGGPKASEWSGVIDAEDERSRGGRAALDAYLANTPTAMGAWIADDAEIGFNSELANEATFLAGVSERHERFEISLSNPIVTKMLHNSGAVFTDLWTSWEGAARSSGAEVQFPAPVYTPWRDGKIATFMHFFDPGPLDEAVESLGSGAHGPAAGLGPGARRAGAPSLLKRMRAGSIRRWGRCSDPFQWPVVVAVVPVRVVQVTVDQVVHMIAVGDRLMSAAGPVHMGGIVSAARVLGGAFGGVLGGHLDAVLVHVIAVGVVQVTVMEVVHVVPVLDGRVPAAGAVRVVVVLVFVAVHFGSSSAACSNTPWSSSSMWWSARE